MTTLQEVFETPVISVSNSFEPAYAMAMPWPGLPDWFDAHEVKSDELQVKTHAESWEDHRRFWRVFSIWWKGKCIAVGRHAGREGDDCGDHWILDGDGWRDFAAFVHQLLIDDMSDEMFEPTDSVGDVWYWYGRRLQPGKRAPDEAYY